VLWATPASRSRLIRPAAANVSYYYYYLCSWRRSWIDFGTWSTYAGPIDEELLPCVWCAPTIILSSCFCLVWRPRAAGSESKGGCGRGRLFLLSLIIYIYSARGTQSYVLVLFLLFREPFRAGARARARDGGRSIHR
jgi:hypothetical protein